MDTYLALTSRRDVRQYAEHVLPHDVVRRILDAGRLSGSARNRQPWRFLVVGKGKLAERLAETVHAPQNVHGAALSVAVAVSGRGPVEFDAGRAAQNMMLAAWNDGVASCPNGIADQEPARELLGATEDERIVTILSFGYPRRVRPPESRSPEEWSAGVQRKPLEDVVVHLDPSTAGA